MYRMYFPSYIRFALASGWKMLLKASRAQKSCIEPLAFKIDASKCPGVQYYLLCQTNPVLGFSG